MNSALQNVISGRIPTKVIKNRLKDKAWFNDDCRRAFNNKQTAYKFWSQNKSQFCWNNFVIARTKVQVIYASAEAQYRRHLQDTFSGASQSHK